MSSQFAQSILRVAVAQICQNIGWHSVQSSPIDLLVDILQRYLLELSKTAHKYCNQYGRTEPNLDDLGLAFKELGILIQEMEEYANNVEPVAFAHKVSAFPVAHPSNIHNLKVENMELFHGSEWAHESIPEVHPELEDDESMVMSPSSTGDNGNKKLGLNGIVGSADFESPSLESPHPSKRLLENSFENPSKKPRLYTEEEGRPMREVTSVFMTSSGLISPACEGRLPDASIPPKMESPLHTLETRVDTLDGIQCGNKDRLLKKEKSKKIKDFHTRKESKKIKLKPSKKEKENKGTVLLKPEKISNSIVEIDDVKKAISEDINQKKKLLKFQKSEEDKPLKVKNDKFKQKEERKNKEGTKSVKTKNKLKNSSLNKFTSIPKSPKSLKVPKSPSRAKSPVVSKTLKPIKSPVSASLKSIVNTPIKDEPISIPLSQNVKTEVEEKEKFMTVYDDLDESREESPEPRLVIDDSAEAQARQEKECRMAVLDECIDAVIQRAMVESEKNAKENDRAMNETIDEVVKNSTIKKTEPRDIYDFTDSSNSSPPLSPKNPEMGSPIIRNKKEKVKTPENITTTNEIIKKGKSKDKTKKKPLSKSKVPSALASPKSNKTPIPVPIQSPTEKKNPTLTTPERKEIIEIDEELPVISTSPLKSTPPPQCQLPPPSLSPFSSSPFISASSHSVNPFSSYSSPFAQFPSRVAFPTPPLFVPHRSDIPTSFFPAPPSPQPLNLAMSGPNVPVKSSDKKPAQVGKSNKQIDDSTEELNPSKKLKIEDGNEKIKEEKKKEPKKDKKEKEKGEKKEKAKKKGKEKLKEKVKPKEKMEKGKSDKKNKLKNEKEKKKTKEKEEKQTKDDSSIPKITFKLGGNSSASGSTKIVIKSLSKTGTSSPPSSSSSPEVENIPDLPDVKTPSPPQPLEPAAPSPPAPLTPPSVPAPPVSSNSKSHPRTTAKGKSSQTVIGKKVSSSSSSPSPPARTVIIETLGTFVDESGNKIWICPACKQPDDGSPMIGCDECDDWYHWVCVGIVVPPKEEESWYCTRCIAKRQGANPRRKKKKHKKEK